MIKRFIVDLKLGVNEAVVEEGYDSGVRWSKTYKVDYSCFGNLMII